MKKRLLNFWKRINKKIVVITNEPGTALHVVEIDGDTPYSHEALGITVERVEELVSTCKSLMKKHENIVKVAVDASKECKHANELFFVTIVIRKMQEDNNNPLGSLMGALFKDPRGED